jgi:hypothetical protein
MATAEQTIIRRDKGDGNTHPVSRDFAIERLAGCYTDPVLALASATESAPAQTPFAVYWPEAVTGKTAGEQIAHAMWLFNGGTIGERELAATIDSALRSYR